MAGSLLGQSSSRGACGRRGESIGDHDSCGVSHKHISWQAASADKRVRALGEELQDAEEEHPLPHTKGGKKGGRERERDDGKADLTEPPAGICTQGKQAEEEDRELAR